MNNPSTPWYGTPQNWADILKGTSEGVGTAMQGASAFANTKKEAKEAKRRTIADLLNKALKRQQGLFRVGQEYSDDLNDYQSQALQQVARGFVDSMRGATNRG
jgi:hypothetical protein